MEFKGRPSVVIAMVRKYIQERSDQVQTLPCNVGYLKDRTYPLADELGSSLDGLFMVFDENRNFPCAWRFEYSSKLRYSLLQNLGWANIDFGYHNHHRHIECQRNSQVLSIILRQALLLGKYCSITDLLIPIRPLLAATMRRQ